MENGSMGMHMHQVFHSQHLSSRKLSNLFIISLFTKFKNHASFSPGINRYLLASEVKFVGVKIH